MKKYFMVALLTLFSVMANFSVQSKGTKNKVEKKTISNINPNATGYFVLPLGGNIIRRFGETLSSGESHTGIDIKGGDDLAVLASEGGLVIYSGWYGDYGKVVIVDHSEGFSTLYAHLETISSHTGDRINQGTILGYVGNTGACNDDKSTYLHFEIRSQGKPQNPELYLSPKVTRSLPGLKADLPMLSRQKTELQNKKLDNQLRQLEIQEQQGPHHGFVNRRGQAELLKLQLDNQLKILEIQERQRALQLGQ